MMPRFSAFSISLSLLGGKGRTCGKSLAMASTLHILPAAMLLQWKTDARTAQAASRYPFPIKRDSPAPQFHGCNTDTLTWRNRITQPTSWKSTNLLSSPSNIIAEFKNQRYTQGVALVVSWGGMGRTVQYIYGDSSVERIRLIEDVLKQCAADIQSSQSIESSWELLTGYGKGRLQWSTVMSSKTLHFLGRALGFQQNPPVPLDGGRMRNTIWPKWMEIVPYGQRPENWEGSSFTAYCRFMTAVITWANQRNWTTTELESTLTSIADEISHTSI